MSRRLDAVEAAVEASADALLAEMERQARRGDANIERVIRAIVEALTRSHASLQPASGDTVSINQLASSLARAVFRGGRFR